MLHGARDGFVPQAMGVALVVGVSIWVADALIDSLAFYEQSFLDSLVFDIPPVELYTRSAAVFGVILFCAATIVMMKRQQSLRRSLDRQAHFIEEVLNSLSHPFYVVDAADFSIKLSNRAANFGEQLPDNATCYALTHGRDRPCSGPGFVCPVEEVVTTGRATAVEHVHIDRSGDLRFVEVHAHPVRDTAGKIAHVIEYSFDITGRKLIEREREKLLEQLQETLEEVQTLRGLLPICSHCKKIRDVDGRWQQLEAYIAGHTQAEFSHGVCPECLAKHYRAPGNPG